MRVAKHWRNQKLRYRLIGTLDRNANEASHSEQKRLVSRSRIQQPVAMRVKVLS